MIKTTLFEVSDYIFFDDMHPHRIGKIISISDLDFSFITIDSKVEAANSTYKRLYKLTKTKLIKLVFND